jgi:hypothetical protein
LPHYRHVRARLCDFPFCCCAEIQFSRPIGAGKKVMARSLVFIDSRVADYQSLIAGLDADTRWVLLDSDHDGVEQMQAALAGDHDLTSIRILAHGRPGALMLGAGELTRDNLDRHAMELATIGRSLADEGDIQIYGCEVGQGSVGRAFVRALAEAVGAHVAASSKPVGHADLDGEWRLDIGRSSTPQLNLSQWHGRLGLTITPLILSWPGKSSGENRNDGAFAALRADGSVVTWGRSYSGGNSSAVATQLDGSIDVTQVFSAEYAFAALRADGSVVTWGDGEFGGDSSAVATQLNGSIDVTQIFSNYGAFAALRADGSVVTWGCSDYDNYGDYGGDSSAVATQLDGTYRRDACVFEPWSLCRAARRWLGRDLGGLLLGRRQQRRGDATRWHHRRDASVFDVEGLCRAACRWLGGDLGVFLLWRRQQRRGDATRWQHRRDAGVFDVECLCRAAGRWLGGDLGGDSRLDDGGDSSAVASATRWHIDVTHVFSNDEGAFAALRADGSVVTWGRMPTGAATAAPWRRNSMALST